MMNGDVICANAECTVRETGKCVDGRPFEACSFYGRTLEPVAIQTPPPLRDVIPLLSGDRLDTAAAEDVMCATDTRAIAVVGAHDVGKTSLIACIFGLLQDGPIEGHQFAGSLTLVAFERACHHARTASGNERPASEHTSRNSGIEFYHLAMRSGGRAEFVDLLIADRAGEEYRALCDDFSDVPAYSEIGRADVITLLIDGGRLMRPSSKHQTITESTMLVQALVESGLALQNQRLAVVLTKRDEVVSAAKTEEVERAFAGIIAEFEGRFATFFGEIVRFETAASPATNAVPRGFGVGQLFEFWLRPPRTGDVPAIAITSARVLDRLTADSTTEAP